MIRLKVFCHSSVKFGGLGVFPMDAFERQIAGDLKAKALHRIRDKSRRALGFCALYTI